jgi:hypothetical protein
MVNGIIRPAKRKIRVEKTYLVTFSGRYSEIILVVFEPRRLSRQAGLTATSQREGRRGCVIQDVGPADPAA